MNSKDLNNLKLIVFESTDNGKIRTNAVIGQTVVDIAKYYMETGEHLPNNIILKGTLDIEPILGELQRFGIIDLDDIGGGDITLPAPNPVDTTPEEYKQTYSPEDKFIFNLMYLKDSIVTDDKDKRSLDAILKRHIKNQLILKTAAPERKAKRGVFAQLFNTK